MINYHKNILLLFYCFYLEILILTQQLDVNVIHFWIVF